MERVLALVLLASSAVGQTAADLEELAGSLDPRRPGGEEAAVWIEDLGADEPGRRAAATAALVALGPAAVDPLEGVRTSDPEVGGRIEAILDAIRTGARGERRPTEVLEAILALGAGGDGRWASTLDRLAARERFPAAAAARLARRSIDPAGRVGLALDQALDVGVLVVEPGRAVRVATRASVLYDPDRAGEGPPLVVEARARLVEGPGTAPGETLRAYRDRRLAVGGRAGPVDPLVGRRLAWGDEGLVALDGAGRPSESQRILIHPASRLGRLAAPGRYEPGRPVDLPPACLGALLDLVDLSVAWRLGPSIGRAVLVGPDAAGRPVLAVWAAVRAEAVGSGRAVQVWAALDLALVGPSLDAVAGSVLLLDRGADGEPDAVVVFETSFERE